MPYGISNYEKMINDWYYYVDKTKYIEKLENLPETNIMFLRPRKFGKTLFTSVLENFSSLVYKNGRVRKWYEVLKEGTETVVDRIFITGVAPITLDSLTSGFNIGTDITQDIDFNDMMGFTRDELVGILNNQEICN